jgi:hypothetical protein
LHLKWNVWNDIRKPHHVQEKAKINSEIVINKPENEAAEKKCNVIRSKTKITKKLMFRKEGQ